MTTIASAPQVRPGAGSSWRGFGTLLRTETVVWMRDFASVFFGLMFPTVLMLGVGFLIPGMRDPITEAPLDSPWYGVTPIATYLPTVVAMAIATLAITALPVTFATFREKGVLRRLSTTPMRSQAIVVAHLVINVVVTIVGVIIALIVAQVAFGIVRPLQLGVVLLAFTLGMLAMFSLGILIAAWAPRASSATAVGMLLYFPQLLLAGLWTPGPIMPELLRQIGQFTPLGAASQALTMGWFEEGFPALQVVVMVVWTAVLLPLGVRLFKWS
jgi:ABC-2 type transport system permease protein